MGCRLACTFALLVISGEMGNFLFAGDLQKEVPCVDSGQTVDDKPLLYPQNATPTECSVTGPTAGFKCTIGNYYINYPDACEHVDRRLKSTLPPAYSPRLDEVCQPMLTGLNLYRLTCQYHDDLKSVSLNFSFELPLCDEKSASEATAVKVDFMANKNFSHNYFFKNPICRLFNYTGSDFSYISNFSEKIVVAYEWIAVGLKDLQYFPQIYYYLSLTAFPSGAQLNYTIVYLDVSSQSMRLVAGAWRSQCTAHFVFLPIDHIKSYHFEAVSSGPSRWKHSEVVTDSTFELKNIPVHSNIVTVTVIPYDGDTCRRLKYSCSPIRITLHDKKTLNLPVDPPLPLSKKDEGLDWRNTVIIAVGSVVALALLAATIAVIRHQRRLKGRGEAPAAPKEVGPVLRRILIITSLPEHFYQALHSHLTDNDFTMDALTSLDHCVNRMRDCKIIFLIIHPHMSNYPEWTTFVKLVLKISENGPLWTRVRVISLDDQGEFCQLQDFFHDHERDRPQLIGFWSVLNRGTHRLQRPEDEESLIMDLNEMCPRECPQVHDEEDHDQALPQEPRRHNQGSLDSVPENVPADCVRLLASGEAVTESEDDHDHDHQSDAGASGVSALSYSLEPAEPLSYAPIQVEAEIHVNARGEDQHREARQHLSEEHHIEASDDLIEMSSMRVLPQGSLPYGSVVPSQSQPTVRSGYRTDVEETVLKVPFEGNAARVPGDLSTSEETVPKVQYIRGTGTVPGLLTKSEETARKVPVKSSYRTDLEETDLKVPLERNTIRVAGNMSESEGNMTKAPHRGDATRMPEDLPESEETVPKIVYGRDTQRVPGYLTESEETVPKVPVGGCAARVPEDLPESEQTVPMVPFGIGGFGEAEAEIPLPGKSSGSSKSNENWGSFEGGLKMTDDRHFIPTLDYLLPSVSQSDSTGMTKITSSPGGRMSFDIGGNNSNRCPSIHGESPDLPHFSFLLQSTSSENQEQPAGDPVDCLSTPSSAATPGTALREISPTEEENSCNSSLGNFTSLPESDQPLLGASQPGYREQARHNNSNQGRVDQSYHSDVDGREVRACNESSSQGARPKDDREVRVRNYSPGQEARLQNLPAQTEVCGPEKYMNKLSDRVYQQGRHSATDQLRDLPAVHRMPHLRLAGGEGHNIPVRVVGGDGERSQLSGASAVCGPEDQPFFQSIRNNRQRRDNGFSVTRDCGTPESPALNGLELPGRNDPERRTCNSRESLERNGPERNSARKPLEKHPRQALESAESDESEQAIGWKQGVQGKEIHMPPFLNANESVSTLRERGERGDVRQHPYLEAQRRAEGIRYEGHRDAEGGRVFEPRFQDISRDFEQGPPNHQQLGRNERPGEREGQRPFRAQYPPNLPFVRIREAVQHDELNGIDGDNNLDSGFHE